MTNKDCIEQRITKFWSLGTETEGHKFALYYSCSIFIRSTRSTLVFDTYRLSCLLGSSCLLLGCFRKQGWFMQTSSRFVCTARFVEASTPDLCRPHMRFVEVRKLLRFDKFLQNPGGTLHCGEEIPFLIVVTDETMWDVGHLCSEL